MHLALFVVRGQRVPVGDEVEAVVVVLQAHPVLQGAVVVAEVHGAGGAHAGEDAGLHGGAAWPAREEAPILADRTLPAPARRCLHEAHRHPDLRPRLQHGGHRAALRRRRLAGARGGGHRQPRRCRRACSSRPRTASRRRWSITAAFADARGLRRCAGDGHRRVRRPTWWCWPASCASSARDFVRRYEGRLLNIHPSLLPAFPGLHTHRRAIDAGLQAGRRDGALRDARARPRADRHPVGGAGAAAATTRGA